MVPTSAVPVVGLSGAVRIVASDDGYCALLNNARVKCWGYNTDDAPGDGTSNVAQSFSDVPVNVR